MVDLSHWIYTNNFSGADAAALILGIDPSDPDADLSRTRPVLEGMKHAHKVALISSNPEGLQSRWVLTQQKHRNSDIRKLGPDSVFELQIFGRKEIARWLVKSGMKSVYPFGLKAKSDHGMKKDEIAQTGEVNAAPARWPWGNHHTQLLGHLDAAGRRYWGKNYDPADTTSASTNVTVSQWLQNERKVSKTMADAIASMLRADGLPTGPRR